MVQVEGPAPIELLVRSKVYFDFMEPVAVELRLRNVLSDLPLEIDPRLTPDFGGVSVYVRRPDGRILEYAPITCKLASLPPAAERTLYPSGAASSAEAGGKDRYSELVPLSYGRYGFYFDQPGEYLVRAIYQGMGDILIPSNVHRIRIGAPDNKEEDRRAQDFFSYEVGMSLYLRGSRSPYLKRGMDYLREVAERYKGTALGAKAASAVAGSFEKPFYCVERPTPVSPAAPAPALGAALRSAATAAEPGAEVRVDTLPPEPEEVLAVAGPALETVRGEQDPESNLLYRRLVMQYVNALNVLGRKEEAARKVEEAIEHLKGRGVPPRALREIERDAGVAAAAAGSVPGPAGPPAEPAPERAPTRGRGTRGTSRRRTS
jgi:hypothetical protein